MGTKRKRQGNGTAESEPNSSKHARSKIEKKPFEENPTGDERKREARLYELLGSEDESERLEAADCIVSSLFTGADLAEDIIFKHLKRRLFRGLTSGRNASRIGFSLVITEILEQLFSGKGRQVGNTQKLSFENVLDSLLEQTRPVGNISGQEERDHYLGQLFGLECFVRSKVLFAETARWETLSDLLVDIGVQKSWLRSQSGWIIAQALSQTDRSATELTLRKLGNAGVAQTPEGLAIWLIAMEKFPSLKVKPWEAPLKSKSLHNVAAVLRESFQEAGIANPAAKQSGWSAQLHFVWDILLGHFGKGKEDSAEAMTVFWNRVVDDSLFAKNATDGQKFKGFQVFQHWLSGLSSQPDKVASLFSKNLMKCLINQAKQEDRYLHRAALKSLKTVEGAVEAHPYLLIPVLEKLLNGNGVPNFDQQTNTKTVQKLIQQADGQIAKEIMPIIKRPLSSMWDVPPKDAAHAVRVYVEHLSRITIELSSKAAAMATLGRDPAEELGPLVPYFLELSGIGFGSSGDKRQGMAIRPDAITDSLRETSRARIESALLKLSRSANGHELFSYGVECMSSSHLDKNAELYESTKGARKRIRKLHDLGKKHEADQTMYESIAMLYSVAVFQIMCAEPDAFEVLKDLEEHSRQLFDSGNKGNRSAGSEFLVEILLSLVARPSSLMREVSQQVFASWTRQISDAGFALLIAPLSASESTAGQKELFDAADDDDMDVDEAASDEDTSQAESEQELDSDVELIELDKLDGKNGAAEEDEEDQGEGEEAQDLDELVGNILRSHRLDKDNEADSSSSDEDMSDSEMLALDDKLAEVFKHRVQARPDSKKQKKDAKQTVVNFKHRVLDLIDIFMKQEVGTTLAFSFLVPLLELVRSTSTKPLANRACEIILTHQKSLKKKGKGSSSSSSSEVVGTQISSEELYLELIHIHDEVGSDNAHAYAKAASAASLSVASAMLALDREVVDQIASVYAGTQAKWVLGKKRMQASFFSDWVNWCQNHASTAGS